MTILLVESGEIEVGSIDPHRRQKEYLLLIR